MQETTGDKCFDLYNLSVIKKTNQIKQDKTAEQYEFEKNKEELTFQPNLQKKKAKDSKVQYKVNHRSEMDTIERMRKAREEREFKKQMTERGYNPAKAAKPPVHSIDKTPLTSNKDLTYARKPAGPPRAPDESTLMDHIHNLKPKKIEEFENEEPRFQPEINPVPKKKQTPNVASEKS
jgi:hypothetical protein